MTVTPISLGDLVDAEYVDGIRGAVRLLRGIVTGIGEWDGKPTHSVSGFDAFDRPASTMSSAMPVHFIAPRQSQAARDVMRQRQAVTEGRALDRLCRIAVEEMGM